MIEYSIKQERLYRLKEKERQEFLRKIDACYNEELDLWNTTKLAELKRERIFREIFGEQI
jgi:hypothetical protein